MRRAGRLNKKLWCVANTSGYTDVLAFLGFNIDNLHAFATVRSIPDLRILTQSVFMNIYRKEYLEDKRNWPILLKSELSVLSG